MLVGKVVRSPLGSTWLTEKVNRWLQAGVKVYAPKADAVGSV